MVLPKYFFILNFIIPVGDFASHNFGFGMFANTESSGLIYTSTDVTFLPMFSLFIYYAHAELWFLRF